MIRGSGTACGDVVTHNSLLHEVLGSAPDREAVLARFPDGKALPDWSVDAFAWAIDRGVINGMDGCLAPDEPSNRAQVAVMLYRFFYEG